MAESPKTSHPEYPEKRILAHTIIEGRASAFRAWIEYVMSTFGFVHEIHPALRKKLTETPNNVASVIDPPTSAHQPTTNASSTSL